MPIQVSMVLSIHNRSKLFRRALDGLLWQTLPAAEWEVVLVDDGSTENLEEVYRPFIGRINLTHVRMDHTRHPVFRQRNPGWVPGKPKDWYHTPAISINLGTYLARGSVIGLCHPEILHAPGNFKAAVDLIARKPAFYFGKTWLGDGPFNATLDRCPDWTRFGTWPGFCDVYQVEKLPKFGNTELYWYTSFLPKKAVEAVGGVDFVYLNGVAGEDDDFRDRVKRSGCEPTYTLEIQGLHQDHSDEPEAHRRRDTDTWKNALARNRAVYFQRVREKSYPQPANAGMDWTGSECLLELARYVVGMDAATIVRPESAALSPARIP